jgi:hypothetical protein
MLAGLLISGKGEKAVAGEVPNVIINEVAWAGSSASSEDEWLELKNTTTTDINLTGWQITKYTSSKKQQLMISIADNPTDPNSTTIPAGGYFLIANNGPEQDFDGQPSRLNVLPNIINDDITLADGNLWVRLYNDTYDEDGELIDQAGNGGPAFYRSGGTKVSMERNDVYGSGDNNSSWHAATKATNIDLGVSDKGTPKAINSPVTQPAPIVSYINPTSASIDTILKMTSIEGDNFSLLDPPKIKLRHDDQTITATEVHVLTPMLIDSARFDLHGAETGKWDMVIINPDGQDDTLPNALDLIEPEEDEEELDYSNNIIINEIYPRPSASSNDEFIELYNTGDSAVNLRGWQLDDQSPGGSAPYTIADNEIIPPKGYLTFTKTITHLSLNDSGDSARLLQPHGALLSQLTYDSAPKGQSYAWLDERWQWTLRVTKNTKNILELKGDDDENAEEEVGGEQSASADNPQRIELELSVSRISDSAITLEWQLDELGYVDEVEIFVSLKESERGELNRTISARQREAEMIGLKPDTKYFFTITGDYNAYTAISNQVSATTKSGTPAQKLNDSRTIEQLIITELLPNPGGGDSEWIEIHNPTDQPISLTGWKLMDKSKRCYVFSRLDLVTIQADNDEMDEVIIEPGQYLLLDQDITGIHLNNSGGEEIYLIDSENNIIDTATYTGTVKRDYVYTLAPNEKWFWTTEATPGAANNISFVGELADGNNYLTPSGSPKWWLIGWLSLLLSAIMLVRTKRYAQTVNQR